MTHHHLTDWRVSRLTEWRETDLADRITLEAPELRHVSDPAPARCVVTTGRDAKPIHIGGAVSRKSASPYAGYGPHRRPSLLRRIARRVLVASVSLVGSVNVKRDEGWAQLYGRDGYIIDLDLGDLTLAEQVHAAIDAAKGGADGIR